MSDHMKVGDILAALERYAPEREVAVNSQVVKSIVSIEPGGAVMFVLDEKQQIDTITAAVSPRKQYRSPFGLMFGQASEDDE